MSIPDKLLEAIKSPLNLGLSIKEIEKLIGVKIKTTKPKTVPDINKSNGAELYRSIAWGLTQIFNEDRRRINDPDRLHPYYEKRYLEYKNKNV